MERLTFLEQKYTVLLGDVNSLQKNLQTTQREVSEVLGEMQMTIQGIARALNMSLATINERLTWIENEKPTPSEEELTGK